MKFTFAAIALAAAVSAATQDPQAAVAKSISDLQSIHDALQQADNVQVIVDLPGIGNLVQNIADIVYNLGSALDGNSP